MSKPLVAFVTGGSSGIGEAVAKRLASLGITTYTAARRTGQMESMKNEGIHVLPLDLNDPASIDACMTTFLTETGGADILVNCAGYGSYGTLEEVPMDEAQRQFQVNLFGLGRITQLLIPHMRGQRKGWIINISSIGGIGAFPYGGWYHASKFAVEGYTSALRQELNPFGVNVVVVRPGGIRTGWRDITGKNLAKVSGKGPYAKAVKAVLAKFMGKDFDKMLAEPSIIADLIEKIVGSGDPNPVYTAPARARNIALIFSLMASDRYRDAFSRKFLGLPKTL